MSNSHGLPDTMVEMLARDGDLMPNAIISLSPMGPQPGMTLPGIGALAYLHDGVGLTYVNQPAHDVTLVGADGTYWLALYRDTYSAVSGWTRQPGTHFLWQASPTQPPGVQGVLGLAQLTVAGSAITAVSLLPSSAGVPASWRDWLELGTLAQQDAHAAVITGGQATGLALLGVIGESTFEGAVGFGFPALTGYAIRTDTRPSTFGGTVEAPQVAVGGTPIAGYTSGHSVKFTRAGTWGLIFLPTDGDGAGAQPVLFLSATGNVVGTIGTTATATVYSTSSDARLKHAITALTGALDVVQALKPVRFRWNADDSVGHGFLAHELQQVIPEAVSGQPEAVNEDGSVKPQGVDHSTLVVWLVAALQDLAARVVSLETHRGL